MDTELFLLLLMLLPVHVHHEQRADLSTPDGRLPRACSANLELLYKYGFARTTDSSCELVCRDHHKVAHSTLGHWHLHPRIQCVLLLLPSMMASILAFSAHAVSCSTDSNDSLNLFAALMGPPTAENADA